MSTEQNKAIVRRVVDEVWNTVDMALLGEVFATDYVCHAPDQDGDREDYKTVVADIWLAAFPDTHLTIDDMVGEGDMLATRFTAVGTHQKEWLGVPATGKVTKMVGMVFSRFADGKIVEEWFLDDIAGALRQIGAIPEPE